MSLRRTISWNAATREMRADRIDPVTAQAYRASVHAAALEAMRAKSGAKLLNSTGGFDRRAIMLFAHASRRAEGMAEALRIAWACAHAARRAGAH